MQSQDHALHYITRTVINLLTVNGPCLLDYLILKLRLPVVLYISFAVVSR